MTKFLTATALLLLVLAFATATVYFVRDVPLSLALVVAALEFSRGLMTGSGVAVPFLLFLSLVKRS